MQILFLRNPFFWLLIFIGSDLCSVMLFNFPVSFLSIGLVITALVLVVLFFKEQNRLKSLPAKDDLISAEGITITPGNEGGRDISWKQERQIELEEVLLRNEYKFRSLISNSPDGIVITDETGVVIEWNGAMENIIGISRKEALGSLLWDINFNLLPREGMAETDNQLICFGIREMIGQGPPRESTLTFQLDILGADGSPKTVKSHCFAIHSDRGNKFAAIIHDVTLEQQKEASIRESEYKLRTIFDNTFEGFILIDNEGRVLEMNQICRRYILRLTGKNVNKYDLLANFIPDDYSIFFRKLVDKTLKKRYIRERVNIKLFNHFSRWIEVHSSLIMDLENQFSGMFINLIDIDNKVKAEEEIKKALEMEKELGFLKSQFISSVSHEFRTPLASIHSNVQLLQRYYDKWDSTRREQTFQRIFGSINHLTALLQNVSLMGKSQAGMNRFLPTQTELIQFCRQIIDDTLTIFNNNREIEFETTVDKLEVLIDENLSRHILGNLLHNAVKYTEPGKLVKFIFEVNGHNLNFKITDQGIGIPDYDLQHVYEPFYRAKNVEGVPGSGLGMAVVKQCVEIHKGQIHIESIAGTGTKVDVVLPYIPA